MIYFIISNSFHIIQEELNKIFKSMDDVEIIDYKDTNIDEIINLCGYTSLFNENKNIIVKNSSFLSSKESDNLEKLEKYIENPNPTTNIVFLFDNKVDERKKIVKLLKEKNTYIYIKPLTYKEISEKLISICKSNGYKLSESNASYITFSSLNNYDIAREELEKVFLYYSKPCEIQRDVLDNIISKSIDDNNFKFVDNVIKRDIKGAMDLIKNLKLFKVEPIMLLSLLAREYRLMLFTKYFVEKGYSNINIAKELSLLDWQTNKVVTNSYSYTFKELEDKLLDLAKLDYELKTGKIDKYLALEMFILKG
ncbi:MAG: DNA polymerase III subunit delta [Bacilli bacterium]|nr:DNA polymerase III subunit delta [Bacilli bacterium]